MFENIQTIGHHSYPPISLMSINPSMVEAYGLGPISKETKNSPFFPIAWERSKDGWGIKVKGLDVILNNLDPEIFVIENFFRRTISKDDPEFMVTYGSKNDEELHYYGETIRNHDLSLVWGPNTPADIRFRQEAVRELVENPEMYKRLGEILSNDHLMSLDHNRESWSRHGETTETWYVATDPKKAKEMLEVFESLEELSPKSGPYRRVIDWVKEMREDPLVLELFKERRKHSDQRIVALFGGGRFHDLDFYLLKPGVNPEDVFLQIDDELKGYARVPKSKLKRGSGRADFRALVHEKTANDSYAFDQSFPAIRQRMDILNEMTSMILSFQSLAIYRQLRHFYQGAYMYKKLEESGVPMAFPEISDDPTCLNFKGIYPIRMLLNKGGTENLEKLVTNDFNFTGHPIVQSRGPNKRGKSETFRTVYLAQLLANSGYPLPMEEGEIGVTDNIHFIQLKQPSGRGGSEFERAMRQFIEVELKGISPGDKVILDEFGDAAGQQIAKAAFEIVSDALIENRNIIYVTGQHDSLFDAIKERGGLFLAPKDPSKFPDKYTQVPWDSLDIDYVPTEILEELGVSNDSIDHSLNSTKLSRVQAYIGKKGREDETRRINRDIEHEADTGRMEDFDEDEEIPF